MLTHVTDEDTWKKQKEGSNCQPVHVAGNNPGRVQLGQQVTSQETLSKQVEGVGSSAQIFQRQDNTGRVEMPAVVAECWDDAPLDSDSEFVDRSRFLSPKSARLCWKKIEKI